MKFRGTIVEESLKDNRLINKLNVVSVRISSEELPENRWHLYEVTIDESEIERLARELKPQKWYMHFWSGDHVVVVFPNKVFRFLHSNRATWADAVEYGKAIGIPEEQLDFVIE